MRTTVTLDPDVEQLVRQRMRVQGISFKQALNETIREGARGESEAFVTPAFDMGVPMVDLTKALTLAGELEDEGLVRSLRRGA